MPRKEIEDIREMLKRIEGLNSYIILEKMKDIIEPSKATIISDSKNDLKDAMRLIRDAWKRFFINKETGALIPFDYIYIGVTKDEDDRTETHLKGYPYDFDKNYPVICVNTKNWVTAAKVEYLLSLCNVDYWDSDDLNNYRSLGEIIKFWNYLPGKDGSKVNFGNGAGPGSNIVYIGKLSDKYCEIADEIIKKETMK